MLCNGKNLFISVSTNGIVEESTIYIFGVHLSALVPGIDRDNDSGEYTQTYPDSDFIDAIDELGGMASTSDISDTVGCTHRTAYTRLQAIEEQDLIQSRKVGNSILWVHNE